MRFDELKEQMAQEQQPRRLAHREHDLQVACVRWFACSYPQHKGLLFAVPNGAMLNGSAQQRRLAGMRLRDEGMVKGVADLLLLVPNKRYHGLCVEMKSPRGSLAAEQKAWGALVEARGYKFLVIKGTRGRGGLEQFIDEINAYLKG